MIRKVKTPQSIGSTLAHDMTKIVPGEFRGARFTRGHIVTEADVPELLSMGKEHVYIMDQGDAPGVHEEEAGCRLAGAASGANTEYTKPKEGRVNINATAAGIVKINISLLNEINSIEGVVLTTLHANSWVEKGSLVAATKIIPLYIEEEKLAWVESLTSTRGKVIEIKPFSVKKVAVVVTGNEVYKGLIKDKFVDVIRSKVEPMGGTIFATAILPDDEDKIAASVRQMKDRGAELIVACGGLSVDPDDVTVEGVSRSGARIISYGSPVMPGAMILFAVLDNIPVLGAPAGGLFHRTGIDVFLPRLMAGEILSREEIIASGHGGLCLNCHPCLFPVCPFGK